MYGVAPSQPSHATYVNQMYVYPESLPMGQPAGMVVQDPTDCYCYGSDQWQGQPTFVEDWAPQMSAPWNSAPALRRGQLTEPTWSQPDITIWNQPSIESGYYSPGFRPAPMNRFPGGPGMAGPLVPMMLETMNRMMDMMELVLRQNSAPEPRFPAPWELLGPDIGIPLPWDLDHLVAPEPEYPPFPPSGGVPDLDMGWIEDLFGPDIFPEETDVETTDTAENPLGALFEGGLLGDGIGGDGLEPMVLALVALLPLLLEGNFSSIQSD